MKLHSLEACINVSEKYTASFFVAEDGDSMFNQRTYPPNPK